MIQAPSAIVSFTNLWENMNSIDHVNNRMFFVLKVVAIISVFQFFFFFLFVPFWAQKAISRKVMNL